MSEIKKIAVIGAGQLGSRHLQSLAALSPSCEIFVVDPNTISLQVAKERWKEVSADSKEAVFFNNIPELPANLDIAIIATSSTARKSVIENLFSRASLRYLVLEKFLFQNESDYYEIQSLIEHESITTWVNCPRRMYPGYKDLKEKLNAPIVMNVTGSNWGIGCNAIHWVDLFCWLTNENLKGLYPTLNKGFVQSKRQGYVEFTGSLIVHGDRGSMMQIHSFPKGTHPIVVTIDDPQQHFFITEHLQQISRYSLTEAWKQQPAKFITLRQSEMTHLVVEDLLDRGKCDLPTYNESMQLHIPLLKVFLDHYNNASETPHNLSCPIT